MERLERFFFCCLSLWPLLTKAACVQTSEIKCENVNPDMCYLYNKVLTISKSFPSKRNQVRVDVTSERLARCHVTPLGRRMYIRFTYDRDNLIHFVFRLLKG